MLICILAQFEAVAANKTAFQGTLYFFVSLGKEMSKTIFCRTAVQAQQMFEDSNLLYLICWYSVELLLRTPHSMVGLLSQTRLVNQENDKELALEVAKWNLLDFLREEFLGEGVTITAPSWKPFLRLSSWDRLPVWTFHDTFNFSALPVSSLSDHSALAFCQCCYKFSWDE